MPLWILATSLTALLLAACQGSTCLEGGDCAGVAPCAKLSFECPASEAWIGRVGDAPAGVDLAFSEGTSADLLMTNGVVTLVLDALDQPHDLAPTGGNVLDFGPSGGVDDSNLIYQIAGILPDDAFAYRSLEIIDRAPDLVVAVLRGTLDGRPDVEVATRYELHRCEPGVRVRSELRNRSPDVQVFILADAAHWGKRRTLPFTPAEGEGYQQPPLDLIELEDSWSRYPYTLARAAAANAATYGFVGCDRDQLEGVNDPEITALGSPRTLVRPGESLVHERFLVAAGGDDAAAAGDLVSRARRDLHGDDAAILVRGRVLSAGGGFGGDVRRASIELGDSIGGSMRPLVHVVPAEDGRFQARVPAAGNIDYALSSFGRVITRGGAPYQDEVDLGDLEVPLPATVHLEVTLDGAPAHAVVAFHPADEATRAAVSGDFHGRFGTCAPWLGPPHGASPACNRVLVTPAGVDLEVPAGAYELYATAGPDATLARASISVADGDIREQTLALARLAVTPPGWLGADLHVHGRASFDSGVPDLDRVRSFAAAGVEVVAATDHDYVTAYADAVVTAGIDDRVVVLGGLETTQLIPFMKVPDDDFPRVIGHFNFWPITPDPLSPRGGAPWDERIEPGELFDIMEPIVGAEGLMMMNHPWDDTQFGRDLGYLRAIKYDPREPIPADDDGSRQGMLMRRPSGGHRNIDFDLIEVMNGASGVNHVRTRPLWFSLLSEGFARAGTASSDSHGLSDSQLGWGRTWVNAGVGLVDFDTVAFDRAVREGRAVGGLGIALVVTVGPPGGPRQGVGLAPYTPASGDILEIEVRAPPWIPVTEVRVVTSGGERVLVSGLPAPADPFGTVGVVRWTGSIPLSDLALGDDDWIVVEAGLPMLPAADLDDDGVPDTGDNDGDGDVDLDDVEEGEDAGPLEPVPDPTDAADPRYWVTRVIPEAWPTAFANPILIDKAGDGWWGGGR